MILVIKIFQNHLSQQYLERIEYPLVEKQFAHLRERAKNTHRLVVFVYTIKFRHPNQSKYLSFLEQNRMYLTHLPLESHMLRQFPFRHLGQYRSSRRLSDKAMSLFEIKHLSSGLINHKLLFHSFDRENRLNPHQHKKLHSPHLLTINILKAYLLIPK